MVSITAPLSIPPLANAFRHVEMTGVFYCPSILTEPWALTMPPMPGCVWFHAVTAGRCVLLADDAPPCELAAGDLALVPHGTGHRISGREPADAPIVLDLPHERLSDTYAILRYGGGGERTELVCGGLRIEHPIALRLLAALPSIIHVDAARSRRESTHLTLELLAEEMARDGIGGDAIVSRLCDVVVLQAIRRCLDDGGLGDSRWLTAMSDPQIGLALGAIHRDPAAPWTLSALADQAMMSRSSFAARFTELLGEPVMRYVTDLRMQFALDLLGRTEMTVASVARAVGYQSDASFSRVFKRVVGVPPRASRRSDGLVTRSMLEPPT